MTPTAISRTGSALPPRARSRSTRSARRACSGSRISATGCGSWKASCVFAEPQFDRRIVDVVVEGTQARAGTIDPLGADIEDGPELYFELMRTLTASFKECLTPAS